MAVIPAAHGAIEYETEGAGQPIVLIGGLGSQFIRWSPAFRSALVDRGFRIIRLDNRDAGLSHGYDGPPTRSGRIGKIATRRHPDRNSFQDRRHGG